MVSYYDAPVQRFDAVEQATASPGERRAIDKCRNCGAPHQKEECTYCGSAVGSTVHERTGVVTYQSCGDAQVLMMGRTRHA